MLKGNIADTISKSGAILSSFFASISCFGPLLAASLGIAGLGGLASLAIYRPYFLGLAGLALLYSLFTTFWEKYRPASLQAKKLSFGKEEILLSTTILLVFVAIYMPYIKGVCPGPSGPIFEGKGLVIQVDQGEGEITLDHEEIKGLLPAMSMEYAVQPPNLLRGLRPGDRVRFKLSNQGLEFVVVEISKEKNP